MADQYLTSDWIKVENDFLQVLMEMQSKWANALHAAHQCERMRLVTPRECVESLDAALEEALEFEKLIKKYIESLNKMKDLVKYE